MEVLLYKYNSVASYKIGQYFNGKGAEGSTAHILAHTILGATVAATGGNNALTAGIAAGGAEAVLLGKVGGKISSNSKPLSNPAEVKSSFASFHRCAVECQTGRGLNSK